MSQIQRAIFLFASLVIWLGGPNGPVPACAQGGEFDPAVAAKAIFGANFTGKAVPPIFFGWAASVDIYDANEKGLGAQVRYPSTKGDGGGFAIHIFDNASNAAKEFYDLSFIGPSPSGAAPEFFPDTWPRGDQAPVKAVCWHYPFDDDPAPSWLGCQAWEEGSQFLVTTSVKGQEFTSRDELKDIYEQSYGMLWLAVHEAWIQASLAELMRQ